MPVRHPVSVATRAPHGETNAYVLGAPERLLVDPADRTGDLDAVSDSIDHVAVTHTHPDHVGAVAAYARDATVWAYAPFVDQFADATGANPDRVFRPGDELGDTGVTALDTPGHSADHVAFVHDGDAVTGDLAFADGSVYVGTPDGDMRAYLASLRRVYARDFDRLHPGHGPAVDSPRDRLSALHAHRRDRERRVLAAVESGAETVEEILEAAYDKDLAGVRDLAARTVRAHLQKLAVENRVTWNGDRALPA